MTFQIENAETKEKLEELYLRDEMQSLLSQAGFTTELLSPTNKDRAIQDILVHTIFKSRREEIEGLREGMEALHLLDFLSVSKVSIPEVFPLDSEIAFSATDVINAVKHDEASSLPEHQQMVIEWFIQYIKMLEKGTYKKLHIIIILCSDFLNYLETR